MAANLDLDVLRSFVAVAELGGFRRASGVLHRTQPAITQQIQRLELQVGAELFHRDNRGVRLTAAGQDLLAYAHRMLAMNDEALRHLRDRRPPEKTRLGTIQDVAETSLPAILERFSATHANTVVEVDIDSSEALRGKLDRQELDLVVAAQDQRPGRAGEILRPEPLVWLASEALLLDRAQPLPIVLCSTPCSIHDMAVQALGKAGVPFRIALLSANLSGLLAAVRAGLGITARGAAFAAGPLVVLDEAEGLPSLPSLQLALLHGKRGMSESTRALARIIRARL